MIDLKTWKYELNPTLTSADKRWCKHYATKTECQCNKKGGVQIVIDYYKINGPALHESYQVDLTAETVSGDWVKLSVYGLDKVEFRHIEMLLQAWEAINKAKL